MATARVVELAVSVESKLWHLPQCHELKGRPGCAYQLCLPGGHLNCASSAMVHSTDPRMGCSGVAVSETAAAAFCHLGQASTTVVLGQYVLRVAGVSYQSQIFVGPALIVTLSK